MRLTEKRGRKKWAIGRTTNVAFFPHECRRERGSFLFSLFVISLCPRVCIRIALIPRCLSSLPRNLWEQQMSQIIFPILHRSVGFFQTSTPSIHVYLSRTSGFAPFLPCLHKHMTSQSHRIMYSYCLKGRFPLLGIYIAHIAKRRNRSQIE